MPASGRATISRLLNLAGGGTVMQDSGSQGYKVSRETRCPDTRNNWTEMMFVTKYRYNCFRKQSVIDTCTAAFRELETLGFKFGPFGFAGTHVHFHTDVPKRYSIQDAETMLKSRAAARIFAEHPGFRKRYPNGSFWSGYEHHQSVGLERSARENYIQNQLAHHGVSVIDDRQSSISVFTFPGSASGDTATR